MVQRLKSDGINLLSMDGNSYLTSRLDDISMKEEGWEVMLGEKLVEDKSKVENLWTIGYGETTLVGGIE